MEEITIIYQHNGNYCTAVHQLQNLYPNYILLKMDYIGFYIPRIWIYKFNYIRSILDYTSHFASDCRRTIKLNHLNEEIEMLDLTSDFLENGKLSLLEYNTLGTVFFRICENNIDSYVQTYHKPLLPLLEFMGLEKSIMDNLTQVTRTTRTTQMTHVI